MAELPIEVWHLIFDRLELVDLSSCAQVSKSVYLKVKAYRIREIAFTGRVHEWFHYTTPTIDHKHRLDYWYASILNRSSFNFDYLKRLKIGRLSLFDLDEINRFIYLEELDIDLAEYENEQSRTLLLANLKVLYLFVPDYLHVKLDTPRLAKVCTCSLEMLEFVYPESVRCIHTFFYSWKLPMFSNLESLVFTDSYNRLDFCTIYDFRCFKQFDVTVLKKLKEIEFYYHHRNFKLKEVHGYYYYQFKENMSMFKRIATNFFALGRPELKMFWYDVQVTDISVLIEYERMEEKIGSLLAFQMHHYDKLKDRVELFRRFKFNSLLSKKLSEAGFNLRSEEFTSKFTRFSFREMAITGLVDKGEILLGLIARSPNLSSLRFWYNSLGQSFFDQMAEIIQRNAIPLRRLQFEHSINAGLNFEFATKFSNLEWLETDQELSNELVSKLFELPMLAEVEFNNDKMANRIQRLANGKFRWSE